MVKYGSDWSSIVQTFGRVWFRLKKIGRVQVENGLRLFQTGRVIVQTIFNGKDKGQVQISTVEYG